MKSKLKLYLIETDQQQALLALAQALQFGRNNIHNKGGSNIDGQGMWNVISQFVEISAKEDADLLVYPHKLSLSTYKKLSRASERDHVPWLTFLMGDYFEPSKTANTIVYRDSMLCSKRKTHEFALPAFIPDILSEITYPLVEKSKPSHPSVGFCGYVGTTLTRQFFRLIGRKEKWYGLHLRACSIKALGKSQLVQTDIIMRSRFQGGSFIRRKSQFEKKQMRREFLNNLFLNDYALCVRGNGNFSYRFYEAMAAGRIPVFVDSDCVLPLEHLIPYREIGVWVPEKRLSDIAEIVTAFHERLSSEKFNELRFANREIWCDLLSTGGFHKAMVADLVSDIHLQRKTYE